MYVIEYTKFIFACVYICIFVHMWLEHKCGSWDNEGVSSFFPFLGTYPVTRLVGKHPSTEPSGQPVIYFTGGISLRRKDSTLTSFSPQQCATSQAEQRLKTTETQGPGASGEQKGRV